MEIEFLLARIYFTLAITFHIIFPAINIGLAWIVFYFEACFVKTGDDKYQKLTRFWTKIFAMLFGVGVVSGIMMSFMFGLTFSKFIDIAGNIIGPLLSFEVLTAFFLEASFLGVMIFGWGKVSKKAHLLSTFLVAFGTLVSAFWILSANSFMQTPAGYIIKDGIFYVSSWKEVIFNPSFWYRFPHVIMGSIMTAAMFVFGISCYLIKKNNSIEAAKVSARISAILLLVSSLLQAYLGDAHGLNTLKHQPSKIAALEGHWEDANETGQPIVLFGIPDKIAEKNHYELAIPKLGSIILTHTKDGKIPALKDYPVEDRPPVMIPFYCFRIMVGLGAVFIFIGAWGVVASQRGKIGLGFTSQLTPEQRSSWCHRLFAPFHKLMTNISILSIPMGVVAVICGWYVTEVGRQPWVIYGLVRAKDAVTPNLDLYSIIFGIAFTGMVYLAIAIILIRYLIVEIKKGI